MPDRVQPATLRSDLVTLEPLSLDHVDALELAATDGELWQLWFTSVPAPGGMRAYVEKALAGQADGHMLPFAIREASTGAIVGTTRYYEIVPALPRLAIGYTWYAKRWQRTHLNTATKYLLLQNAFETVGAVAVEFHTDGYNFDSQRAIQRLGAKHDGTLRAHKARPDGSLRDTMCYSIIAAEWPSVKGWLTLKLNRR